MTTVFITVMGFVSIFEGRAHAQLVCEDNSDCEEGYSCVFGACVINTTCTPNACGGSCPTGTVCGPAGNACFPAACGQCGAAACQCTYTPGAPTCSGCSTGQTCQPNGSCGNAGPGWCGNAGCTTDEQCENFLPGSHCNFDTGNCVTWAACTPGSCDDCDSGLVCDGTGTQCVQAGCGQCGNPACPPNTSQDPGVLCPTCVIDYGNPDEILGLAYRIVTPIAVIIGLFLVVSCAYKIMTTHGDPRELQEAKECITSAIIGLVFILLSVSILRLVINSILAGLT